MSILIKGMDMPTSCADCELAEHYERYELEHYCPFMGWYADYEKCPIIPVPPHGRLIDADALEKEHMKRAYENFRSYQFHVSATAWINEAPTIIPAEEEVEHEPPEG